MTVPNPLAVAIATKAAVLGGVVLLMQFVSGMQGGLVPVHDPWFLLFVSWVIFSCVTAGMPEPTKRSIPISFTDTDTYLWAYRSMHLLAASGTTYFKNKLEFPDENAPKLKQGG